MSQLSLAQISLEKEAGNLTERVQKVCKLPLRFNLHDYEYSTDERSVYSNSHFEGCSMFAGALAKACEINPQNIDVLSRVKEVFCMRGSIGERKMIQRKSGDIVFLIERVPEDRHLSDVIEEMLTKTVKLTFKAPEKKETPKKEEKKEDKKPTGISSEDRQKKIEEATTWFREEVMKLSKNPGPDLSQKIEALKIKFEEKLNVIQKIP